MYFLCPAVSEVVPALSLHVLGAISLVPWPGNEARVPCAKADEDWEDPEAQHEMRFWSIEPIMGHSYGFVYRS